MPALWIHQATMHRSLCGMRRSGVAPQPHHRDAEERAFGRFSCLAALGYFSILSHVVGNASSTDRPAQCIESGWSVSFPVESTNQSTHQGYVHARAAHCLLQEVPSVDNGIMNSQACPGAQDAARIHMALSNESLVKFCICLESVQALLCKAQEQPPNTTVRNDAMQPRARTSHFFRGSQSQKRTIQAIADSTILWSSPIHASKALFFTIAFGLSASYTLFCLESAMLCTALLYGVQPHG
eukprot:6462358-Amphidinium_carterae.3